MTAVIEDVFNFRLSINRAIPGAWITIEFSDDALTVKASWTEKGMAAYTHSRPCDINIIGDYSAEDEFIIAFIAKVNEIIDINKGTPA